MTAARTLGAYILVLTAAAAHASDSDRPPVQPKQDEAVILFLLDNSASLPPLDPNTRRRDAIEMVYSFLRGQPYRLVLFGGREDIYVDQPQRYRNSGQWTDFFFAFQTAKELTGEYPERTEFKIVFITDGKIDPSPRDWSDQAVPKGADLREEAGNRTVRFLEELGIPLYVILIGEEVDYDLIQRMVVAANGSIAASEYSQGIAEFFGDNGVLLQRFVFRVEKHEGLDVLEPIVTRIATPPAPKVELTIAGSLLVIIGMLIGVGVRSFPGPGDREIMELWTGESLQIAVDRLRRVSSDVAAWSWKGLSLVESSNDAAVVMTVETKRPRCPPGGFVIIGMLIGVGVRSFPGPGDREIMELWTGESLQIAVDRLRRVSSDVAAWSWKGLSLVESSNDASVVIDVRDEATEMPPRSTPSTKRLECSSNFLSDMVGGASSSPTILGRDSPT